MRLDWALLANAAEAPPNGLVYILGAGFDTLIRDQYPTPFGGVIVLRLQTTRLETERPHKVEVHCTDEDGNPSPPKQGFFRIWHDNGGHDEGTDLDDNNSFRTLKASTAATATGR